MPKIEKGRLDGVYGMRRFSSAELHAMADEYEKKITNPHSTDDLKWLRRRAARIRKLAEKKQKAIDYKVQQK